MIQSFEHRYTSLKKIIDDKLENVIDKKLPAGIYEPLKYILSGGGKRIRPVLLILSCEAAGGNYKEAIDAAISIEMLHNFTLIHDDIMDNADKRRGKETIHKKWDRDTAILSGDALLGFAYKVMLNTTSKNIQKIARAFTEGIIEVCDGQSLDKEYEFKKAVSLDEYLTMIDKKTSQLLVSCAKIGALVGNASKNLINILSNYAKNIGLAFQIQDDLLDVTADEKKFGKKIGGDIREGKKTYLLLKALEVVKSKNDLAFIKSVVKNRGLKNDADIKRIIGLYSDYNIINSASKEVEKYTNKANKYLNGLKNKNSRESFLWFSDMLLSRNS
jgi:geranylgeranyl diphosphate synthase, type II